MSWLQLNASALLNIAGQTCDIVGAFLVAFEVVRQFQGKKHKKSVLYSFGDFVSNPPPDETDEFKEWDRLKYRNMKWGLGFLVLGFVLQILANVAQFKSVP